MPMGKFIRDSWLTVGLAVVCGLAVAGVYKVENPKIEQNKRDQLQRAALAVVEGGRTMAEAGIEGFSGVYRIADEEGRQVGWAVAAEGSGFQDKIRLVFGLSLDAGEVTGIDILFANETPGLGAKIDDDPFKQQFPGKAAGEPLVVVKKDQTHGNEIRAITAATISTNAVVAIVNKRLGEVREVLAKEGAAR